MAQDYAGIASETRRGLADNPRPLQGAIDAELNRAIKRTIDVELNRASSRPLSDLNDDDRKHNDDK